jgi:hypothetical protein
MEDAWEPMVGSQAAINRGFDAARTRLELAFWRIEDF